MSFNQRVEVVVDLVADKLHTGLRKIKADVAEAEGFFGKLKAGGSSALTAVGGASTIAAAGVTAAAVAAAKGVIDFQKLGVAVGHGVDATGMSAEAFSRWLEVAADVGIEGGALETTVGKFNKTMGASPAVLARYGVEIARTASGQADVNETFLRAVDAINSIRDPYQRSEAAQAMFGRSWQNMAELISRGAPALRADLAAVSEAKVFDDAKVAEARSLRDSFDSIMDAGQDLFLTVGQELAPAIQDLAPLIAENVKQSRPFIKGLGDLASGAMKLLGPLVDLSNTLMGPLAKALGAVTGLVGDVVGGVGDLVKSVTGGAERSLDDLATAAAGAAIANAKAAEEAEGLAEHTRFAGMSSQEMAAALKDEADRAEYAESRLAAAKEETAGLGEGTDEATAAIDALDVAYATLTGHLDERAAWRNLQDKLTALKETIGDSSSSWSDLEAASDDAVRAAATYIETTDDIKPEVKTKLLAELDAGKLDYVLTLLDNLAKGIDIPVRLSSSGLGYSRRASGGPTSGLTLLGEEGPELVDLPGGSFVFTAAQTSALMRGGSLPGGGRFETATASASSGPSEAKLMAAKARMGEISQGELRSFLADELAALEQAGEKYSDDYMGLWEQIRAIDEAAAEEAARAAEEQRRLDEEAARSAQDAADAEVEAKRQALDAERELMAARFEMGEISAAEYEAFLQRELDGTEKYSTDFMGLWRILHGLKRADEQAEAEARKKAEDEAADAQKAANKATEDEERRHLASMQRIREEAARRGDAAAAAAEADQAMAAVVMASAALGTAKPADREARQSDLDRALERASQALFRRADTQANLLGFEDGSQEWTASVMAALQGDVANAAALGPFIASILRGLPQFSTGGVMPGPRGVHGLAWVAGGETVVPTHQPGAGMDWDAIGDALGRRVAAAVVKTLRAA